MTIKEMDALFHRMLRDKAFRALLREDPEAAAAGYDLTPGERANLARFKKRATHNSSIRNKEK